MAQRIAAPGTAQLAVWRRVQVISIYSSGHSPNTVLGTAEHAGRLLKTDNSALLGGHERMAAVATIKRAQVLPPEAT